MRQLLATDCIATIHLARKLPSIIPEQRIMEKVRQASVPMIGLIDDLNYQFPEFHIC